MPERPPPPHPEHEPTPEPVDTWPVEQLASQLDSRAEPASDPAFGEGSRLLVGPEQQLLLEFYPDAGAVRLTAQHSRIELFQQPAPQLGDDRLLFVHDHGDEQIQLAIDQQGSLALHILPHTAPAAPEGPILPESVSNATEGHIEDETAQNEPLTAVSDDVDEPLTNSDDHDDQEGAAQDADAATEPEQARLTITGRIGRNPRFRETRNGTLVASFPVAVPQDDGSTSWHRVAVFNERAEELRDQLASGDRVEVIGYVHQRPRRRRDGSTTTVEELYAAVVKIR